MTEKAVTYGEFKSSHACRYDGVALGEVMLCFDSGVLAAPLKRKDLQPRSSGAPRTASWFRRHRAISRWSMNGPC